MELLEGLTRSVEIAGWRRRRIGCVGPLSQWIGTVCWTCVKSSGGILSLSLQGHCLLWVPHSRASLHTESVSSIRLSGAVQQNASVWLGGLGT